MKFRPRMIVCIIYILLDGLPRVICYETRSVKTRQVLGWTANQSQGYRTDTNVRYKMDCIVTCVTNSSCKAVDFDQNICTYFDTSTFSVALDSTTQHSLVFVRDVFMLNTAENIHEYSYTFSEAGEACSSLGGRLANESELQTLYNNGYQLCVCGWVYEGDRKYPMQTATQGCGNTVGLVGCNWSSRASAWCSLA